MKPLPQMTFEEASKARAALMAIAHVLEEVGIVTIRHERDAKAVEFNSAKDLVLNKAIIKATKLVGPKKAKRQRAKGKRSICANPGCVTGPGKTRRHYLRRRPDQRFCTPDCGHAYFNKIRNFAKSIVYRNERVYRRWKIKAPWVSGPEAAKDVDRYTKTLQAEIDKAKRIEEHKEQHKRGITIVGGKK